MWNEQKIERHLYDCLVNEFGADHGDEYYTAYKDARSYVIDNVVGEITGTEPDLTKHDASHIADVLRNIYFLISDKSDLSALELYCLCLLACFHDVGNVTGRDGHNFRVGEVYSLARNSRPKYSHERSVIIAGAKAHAGKASDGTTDTLKEVTETSNIDGHVIRLRELASILRIADELCEGPHRTSEYRNTSQLCGYKTESRIYHDYAEIINVCIDRDRGCFSIAYNINIVDIDGINKLEKLLELVYHRIIKLDRERQYTKYYSPILSIFKQTHVSINFTNQYGDKIPPILDKLILSDEYVLPIDEVSSMNALTTCYPQLQIDNIITTLKSGLKQPENE